MSEEKIKVISNYNGRCGIDSQELRISRRWRQRGDVVVFTKEQLEELMFDPAFSNMIHEGYLYIDDMEVKKELGIEPEDATEPTLILMSDKELERYWKNMPLAQFKVEVKKLRKAQIDSIVDYAVAHGDDGSIPKANFLTEISGRNVLKGIELRKSI
jgi:hypothetical protein